ncbi:cytochrome b/b6 domain-containing protein [Acetobacter sp. AN02]|uniref:cytochrome b n=1 Tax=Acetobacter sp. AN02 TaxID=2894186 RepID=UPI0024341BCF|nr:cytochrome b/b6 domain-containing protein [Acetobacter sp. AN02]MDG6095596.1 cytochrome b/b6 domain-containing protein [Acetobacter sp. AN02]
MVGITGGVILLLAVVRLVNRLRISAPGLPRDLPPAMAFAARISHVLLYVLMFALPLVGWGMLSAGDYPVPPSGPALRLPPVLPHDPAVWAGLRSAHTVLAFALIVLVHLGAALFHGLIRRDGVLESMTRGGRSR